MSSSTVRRQLNRRLDVLSSLEALVSVLKTNPDVDITIGVWPSGFVNSVEGIEYLTRWSDLQKAYGLPTPPPDNPPVPPPVETNPPPTTPPAPDPIPTQPPVATTTMYVVSTNGQFIHKAMDVTIASRDGALAYKASVVVETVFTGTANGYIWRKIAATGKYIAEKTSDGATVYLSVNRPL